MKTVLANSTPINPEVTYNSSTKTVDITGRSLMLEPEAFWALNINVIKNIALKAKTTLNINLEYVNSSSLGCLSKLIQLDNVETNWVCDSNDDDMIEIGEILEKSTNQNINFLMEN